VNQKEILKENS